MTKIKFQANISILPPTHTRSPPYIPLCPLHHHLTSYHTYPSNSSSILLLLFASFLFHLIGKDTSYWKVFAYCVKLSSIQKEEK